MAGCSNRGTKVSNLWVHLRNVLSRCLAPAEREVMFGDFAELGMTDLQAVESLLDLLMRRQVRHWRKWNPWFVVVAIIVPVCPLLATVCADLDQGIGPAIWMKVHHGISYETGLSTTALLARFCIQSTALITWSWTSGFALGALSRRTICVNGTLFLAVYVAHALGRALLSVGFAWSTWWVGLPLFMSFVFVLLPAQCGLSQSERFPKSKFPLLAPLTVWTIAIGIFTLWTDGWEQIALNNWSRGGPALTLLQLAQYAGVWKAGGSQMLATAVLTGPIFFLLAKNALFHKQRTSTLS